MIESSIIQKNETILITGANGFVGVGVVASLLRHGYRTLRCFVRPSGNLERLNSVIEEFRGSDIEIVKGNLLNREDCINATRNVSVIYHLVAGKGKLFSACFLDSVVTTKNLLDSLDGNHKIKRLVNVSSFSVYSNWKIRSGGLLDETCPVERDYISRYDPYAFGKIKQDDVVVQYGKERGIPYTIMRPGIVFGPGRGGTILGRSGVDTFGFFLNITGHHRIPLTYIDNCADAIVRGGLIIGVDGEIFNIVDDNLPWSGKLVRKVRKNGKSFFSVRFPYFCLYIFSYLWERYSRWSRGQLPPAFNRKKSAAYYKGNKFSNKKLKDLLFWMPKVTIDEGLNRYFEYLHTMEINKK